MSEIGVLAERMKTGLDKLVEAQKSVNALSAELTIKEKDLAVASKEADEVKSWPLAFWTMPFLKLSKLVDFYASSEAFQQGLD